MVQLHSGRRCAASCGYEAVGFHVCFACIALFAAAAGAAGVAPDCSLPAGQPGCATRAVSDDADDFSAATQLRKHVRNSAAAPQSSNPGGVDEALASLQRSTLELERTLEARTLPGVSQRKDLHRKSLWQVKRPSATQSRGEMLLQSAFTLSTASSGASASAHTGVLQVRTQSSPSLPPTEAQGYSKRSALALGQTASNNGGGSGIQLELEKVRHETTRAELESKSLRRRNMMLEHALAASRASKSGAVPMPSAAVAAVAAALSGQDTGVHDHAHQYHDLLFSLLAAVSIAVLQGAFGLLMIVWSGAIARWSSWLFGAPPPKSERRRHCRCCRWSWHSLSWLWGIFFVLDLGFAVMWHYGIVQPFLCQVVVLVYVGIGIFMIVSLAVHEMWLSIRRKMDEAMEVVDFIHDKTDDMLHLMGHGFHRASRDVDSDSELSDHEDERLQWHLPSLPLPGYNSWNQVDEQPAQNPEPPPKGRIRDYFSRRRRLPALGTHAREVRPGRLFGGLGQWF